MEKIDKRLEEQREHFNKRFEQVDKKLDEQSKKTDKFGLKLEALGARWGIDSEKAVRNALIGLYEETFNVKEKQWTHYDQEGKVFNFPSIVEIDVVIQNSEHILIEIKSHVRRSDVTELLRVAELYKEKEKPEKVALIIISPFIENIAEQFAKTVGIKIYSEQMN